ncbi:hypothetical protein ACFU99_11560 [Streptomyces sp. NPDC057654]|uniref:hypothetical protein n=1 Tax=Streptomyces sp. NPDC057654 TaxID=3346196 RepID=UPI0036BCAAB8
MTQCEARDETRYNKGLSRRIQQILDEDAPALDAVTQLRPPVSVYRLLTPSAWRREVDAYIVRAIERGFGGVGPSAREQAEADQLRRTLRQMTAHLWLQYEYMTVTTAGNEPQTLLAPRALHHTGLRRSPQALRRLILTVHLHHGQIAASSGTALPLALRVRRSRYDNRAVQHLMSGHAAWALGQLPDAPAGPPHPLRRSVRHRFQTEWDRQRQRRALAAAGQQEPPPDPGPLPEEAGEKFVAAAIAGAPSIERFNEVWTRLELMPTVDELDDAQQWLRRVGL